MSVVSDVDANGIKTPFLDPPNHAVAGAPPLTYGSRVALFCQGIQLTAQVMTMERPGTTVVGRVIGFIPAMKTPDGLAAGDAIRFQAKDVHRIE